MCTSSQADSTEASPRPPNLSVLSPNIMSDTDSLYLVQDIPGKGRGLVAASKILRGTRILSEAPLIQVPRDVDSKELLRQSISAKLATLSEDQRQAYFSLQNSYPEDGRELGIARTNALPLGSNAPRGGVFIDASRINHSCKQNAQNTWNAKLQKLTIHALRDIQEGEEITIMYLPEREGYEARQRALQASFRFDCSCDLCSLPLAERKLSDERLEEIQKLDHVIGNGVAIFFDPLKALHNVQRLLHLLKSEGLNDASVPRAYYDAFQMAITHGDLARAKVFADRALSDRTILEGHDSPDVEKLQQLSNDPSQHRSCGLSKKWTSVTEQIPKGLGVNDFEDWLWRQQKPHGSQFADLRCELTFPAFEHLPADNDVDLEFFQSADGFSYHPRKNWAFLGEIVDIEALFRLRLVVKDRHDQKIPVAFYTSDVGHELAPSKLMTGYTVVILYAETHGFLDLSYGIRHENKDVLKIFPVSLEELLLLSDKVQTHATIVNGMRTCQGCDKKAASLKKCAKCGFFWYCNKSCQTVGWNGNGHKADCKLLRDPDLRGLFLLKWDNFEGHLAFPLRLGD
ncbi:MYND-type zinc finger protein samB [Fusarium sp. LHS14.1]|nr:MYND-type zinc finger protein samB [Fusarium sp. LHS14.1]